MKWIEQHRLKTRFYYFLQRFFRNLIKHPETLSSSLISSPSWCCRWTCDCRLRSFRLWLTQSNVPRMVEPSCQGPRRLLGIHVQSLSLAEFACAPQLSPTSMYLTVPKGKNVSIVCRVASDPVSTITWFFNGRQIHTSDHEESVSA